MGALATGAALAAALLLASTAGAAQAGPPRPASLSPEAAAAIAPLDEGYAGLERKQAQLPPPKDEREGLERLFAFEDAGGDLLQHLDLSRLPPEQSALAEAEAEAEVSDHNADALKAIAPAQGWFTIGQHGAITVEHTLLLVLLSDDLAWKKEVLARIAPLIRTGEIDPASYAVLYDHIAWTEGRPETYGTTIVCTRRGYVARAFKNERSLDRRRKRIGLLPEWEYLRDIPGCDSRTWRHSTPSSP